MATAHDFAFRHLRDRTSLPLSGFAGRPVLVVNTASACGFTGQYAGLQRLHERFAERGLVVLTVPSNDFGGQEPGDGGTIAAFCDTRFGLGFPLADKEQVRGENAHPFYRWAREEKGWFAAPKWNFHKYLIGRDGRVADYFHSFVSPESPKLVQAIERILAG